MKTHQQKIEDIRRDKYFVRKIGDINGYIAVVCGVANMTGCMFGKCTDSVIKCRDEMAEKVEKEIILILKRYLSTTNQNLP